MLISIRKKMSGWVAWLVVIIIAVPFAFFGINAYFEGGSQINVANVDGNEISLQTYQQAAERQRQFYRNQFGANFDSSILDTPEARRVVLDQIVSNQLERNYVVDHNLTLTDAALQRRIMQNSSFQEDGEFSPDAYRRILSALEFNPDGFEQQERSLGAVEQLRRGLIDSTFFSPSEVERLLALNLQQRKADYLVIEAKPLEADITISDADIAAEYEQNPDAYEQAERVKVEYVELNIADIETEIELTEAELLQAYETVKGRYTQPESRKASHILLEVSPSASQSQRAQVLEKAQDLLEQAQSGSDFAQLAQEHSDDPGSRSQGGNLGIIGVGQMVPAFEEAVFSLAADEITGPVETQFGYHLIKLTELVPERQQAFEEVRDVVRAAEQKRLAQEQFDEVGETLRLLAYEQPEDLLEVSESLDLPIKTSPWFSRSQGNGLFSNPALRAAAFSPVVLEEELNSEVLEVTEGQLIALRKQSYEAAHLKELTAVKQQISDQLRAQRAQARALQEGEAITQALRSGNAPSEEVTAKLKALPLSRADISDPIERELSVSIYKAPTPAEGEAEIQGLSLRNGDYAVFRLTEVIPGDPSAATAAQRQQVEQQLSQRDGENAYALFRQALRASSDVEVFDEALNGDSYESNY